MLNTHVWDGRPPPGPTEPDHIPHPFEHRRDPSYLNHQGLGGTAHRPISRLPPTSIHFLSACRSTRDAHGGPRLETLYQCSPGKKGDPIDTLCNHLCDMTASDPVRGQVSSHQSFSQVGSVDHPHSRFHSSDQAMESVVSTPSCIGSSSDRWLGNAGRFEAMDDDGTHATSPSALGDEARDSCMSLGD
jgi:hypothetical protein